MTQIIIKLLLSLAVIIVVKIIFALISNDKVKKNDNTVKLPKAYAIIGSIAYIIFHLPIIAYIATNDYSRPEMIIFFSVFIILCFLIIISFLNWKIEFGDEAFKYRTIFRHTLNFKYSDIILAHRTKVGTILIKAKNRWLVLDPYAIGLEEFLEVVNIKTINRAVSQSKTNKKRKHYVK